MNQEKFNELMAFNIIWLPENNKLDKIFQNDVIYIEANGNYTNVYLKHKNNTSKTYTIQLGKIEPQLNKSIFIRIHRSYIINITQIEFISLSKLECKLIDIDKMIPIGNEIEELLRSFFKSL